MKKSFILLCFTLLLASCQSQSRDNKAQVKQSIDNSLTYFRNLGTDIDRRDVIMILFILEEHFNYPFKLLPVEEFKKKDLELAVSYFKLYDTYFEGRTYLDYHDSTVNNYLASNLNNVDGLTVWSMFCNKFPLSDDYLSILDSNIGKGKYWMSHAALQFVNTERLGCIQENNETKTLRNRLATELVKQINSKEQHHAVDDLRYECLAMLYYLGADSLINKRHIHQLMKSQKQDGGWVASLETEKTNIHTSVLALWVLLEYYSRLH